MSRRKALHHHWPAVGPASRRFVVLPFAQPTAFTAGCGLVRLSVSSPGATRSVFWHRTTFEPHARSGSAATATRCSPREPACGTRATMACGGLKKINASTTEDGVSLAQILDDPRPFKLPLFSARYTISAGAVRCSWCLQVHVASAFSGGVLVSAFSLWVGPGAFCVLRSSSFSLGFFRCFGILMSGFGVSLA